LRERASGLSIGRGALYNPWIFKEIKENSATNPSFQDRLEFMIRHLEMLSELCGERSACCQFRKIAPFYTRRMGPSREINHQISQCTSLAQFHQLEQYSKEGSVFWTTQVNLSILTNHGRFTRRWINTLKSATFSKRKG
jgi:tRNA-dihydrouridine synthase